MGVEDRSKFTEQMLAATFEFAKLGISSVILLNGAGATAFLAFLGTHSVLERAAWLAVTCFACGAALGGGSSILAYIGQRLDWEVASNRRAQTRWVSSFLIVALLMAISGFLLFAVGSVAGVQALRVLGAPNTALNVATLKGTGMTSCTEGSLCFELVKGIPAAIVALVIGIVGALIALRQAAIARAKLKLDLFEKRYPIFLETWQIMSEVAMKGTREKNYGLGNPFSNFMPQARFLFGKDVESYLSNAVKQWADLHAIELESEDAGERARQAKRRSELSGWFFDQASTGVKELFGRYLDFERWK